MSIVATVAHLLMLPVLFVIYLCIIVYVIPLPLRVSEYGFYIVTYKLCLFVYREKMQFDICGTVGESRGYELLIN